MILSIGMIVKNEEKYLDRCLCALMPILEKVDGELIVADTGSTDKTVEIAKKYTDKVYSFEWINDFSAARNFTLDKAEGEWFWYIDADEIFETYDEIVKFFCSDEKDKYNSVDYIIRNYTNSDNLNNFTDFFATRIFRISKETRFEGKIHEKVNYYPEPKKSLNDICGHYGYVFNEEDVKEKKYKRNMELLEERLKTEKPTSVLYLQLAQTASLYDNDLSLKYARLGLELEKNEGKTLFTVSLYGEVIFAYYCKSDYENLLAVCDEYFLQTKELRAGELSTDADVFYIKLSALVELERHNEVPETARKFISLYKRVESGKLRTDDIMNGPLKFALKANFPNAIMQTVSSCVDGGFYSEAADFLREIDISEYYADENSLGYRLLLDFSVMRGTRNYRRVQALYNRFDEKQKATLRIYLRREIELKNRAPEVNDFLKKIVKNEKDFAELFNVVKVHFAGGNCLEIAKKISEDGLRIYHEILYYLLAEGEDVSLITALEDNDFEAAVYLCATSFEDFFKVLENYRVENISTVGLRGMLNVLEFAMLQALQTGRDIEKLFALWGNTGLLVCEEEKLSVDELSGQLFGAVMAVEALREKEQGDYQACVNALLVLVKQYPSAKPFVLAMKENIQKAAQPMSEMEKLSVEFKNNIRSLIADGNKAQAGQLLIEYRKIMPADKDIEELESALNSNK